MDKTAREAMIDELTRKQVATALCRARAMLETDSATPDTAQEIIDELDDVQDAFAAQRARIEELDADYREWWLTAEKLRADNDALREVVKRTARPDCRCISGKTGIKCLPCEARAVLARTGKERT